jgi:hypothetical protein
MKTAPFPALADAAEAFFAALRGAARALGALPSPRRRRRARRTARVQTSAKPVPVVSAPEPPEAPATEGALHLGEPDKEDELLAVVTVEASISPPASPAPPPSRPPLEYDVSLPAGSACRDCAHFARCRALICTLRGDETKCDFTPSRFVAAPKASPPARPRESVPTVRRRPCQARCAHTGKACALLDGHALPHASGSYRFTLKAFEGQTHFTRAAALELAATRNPGEGP